MTRSHPAVAEVAVIGLPDARLGERVAAFLTIAAGQAWPGQQALLAHLEHAMLARQKFPVEWYVLDELPMTASGRIQKHNLVAGYADETE